MTLDRGAEAEVMEGVDFVARAPKLMEVLGAVSAVYMVGKMDVMSPHRFHHLVGARGAFYWLARHLTPRSYPEIGRFLGGRDHSTVIHGISVINRRMERHRDKLRIAIEKLGYNPDEVLP